MKFPNVAIQKSQLVYFQYVYKKFLKRVPAVKLIIFIMTFLSNILLFLTLSLIIDEL
jgi:hypothetical protein